MHEPLRKTFLLLLLAAVTAACWWVRPDDAARRFVQDGLQRSLASFAAARAIGAALAVAQGTEVTAQPLGVGVVLAPGQALKPASDLVEQFATLMLAASAAFGVQLLLANIGAHWLVSALLTAALVAWVALRWRSDAPRRRAARRLAPVLAALLLARFAVPALAAGNEALFRLVMAPDYAVAQATLADAGQRPPADEGWLDRLKRAPQEVQQRLGDLAARVGRAVEQMVRLIAFFLLQTLLLPLFFLWLLRRLCRMLLA